MVRQLLEKQGADPVNGYEDSIAATEEEESKPGDEVPASGIHEVTHDRKHLTETHEVTCVRGRIFPSYNRCGRYPPFALVHEARHVKTYEHFKQKAS